MQAEAGPPTCGRQPLSFRKQAYVPLIYTIGNWRAVKRLTSFKMFIGGQKQLTTILRKLPSNLISIGQLIDGQ
jgi:hypothetical protein